MSAKKACQFCDGPSAAATVRIRLTYETGQGDQRQGTEVFVCEKHGRQVWSIIRGVVEGRGPQAIAETAVGSVLEQIGLGRRG